MTPVIFRSVLLPRHATQFRYLSPGLQYGLRDRRGDREERVADSCWHSQPSRLDGRGQCSLQKALWSSIPQAKRIYWFNTGVYLHLLCNTFFSTAYTLKDIFHSKITISQNINDRFLNSKMIQFKSPNSRGQHTPAACIGVLFTT